MRVALVSPLFESVPPRLYGGTERVIYQLCRGLTDSNIEVFLFASADSAVEGKLIPVVEESLRLRKQEVKDPAVFSLKMLSIVAERADEFDIIHNHHDYWMLPLTQMTKTPMITTLHGRLDLPDVHEIYNRYADADYVAISESQRNPLPHLSFLKTIYHGLDTADFKFYERPGQYLAFLGRISPEKRPDLAIQIARQAGIPLKIAAKIEGKESRLYFEKEIRPHVDGKFIEFLGEISEAEKSEFLGNALALVFPIDWPEPFGLVAIESLACGTPVLARPYGAVPELLKDGVTGFLSFDMETLATRVKDIATVSRRGCREWVEKKFSLQRMTEEYIHVYRHVAARRHNADRHRWNFVHPV